MPSPSHPINIEIMFGLKIRIIIKMTKVKISL